MTITIETRGRRHYLIGDTFPIKGAIKSAGCKWDPDAKAWYTGKRETADALVAQVAAGAVQATASYRKLPDGSWGILVPGTATVGATVAVVTKAGGSKQETVLAVLEQTDRGSLCSVAQRPRAARGSRPRRHAPGFAPVKGCGACAQLGRMCQQCQFDEYDM